ncbi:hypothetical protein [Clostridium tunisiense]|uniref:hypothetical protein n=1 Tax=Clostridium tunisiense TaxID=219748 RepID=UPI0002D3132F|nr:hypothetical protein [Clostridium tunisiense]
MGYLREVESFFDSIQNNSARSLSYDRLIKSFLQYMGQEYGYGEECYRKDFNEENLDYKDFNEYIYKYYMGLNRDLRGEYENVEREAKERIKLYEECVNNLSNKVKSISSSEKYTREKYKFFLNINVELLEKAKKAREKANIFQRALTNCREKPGWGWSIWSYDNTFSDIQQYVHIDWKSKINFLEASIKQGRELTEKKHSDYEQYLILFKNYINEHNILEKLLCISSRNYYLQNRQEIIKEAIDLFEAGNYTPFVYMLVPQIEGLFDVYKTVLGINNEEMHNGLVDKLNVINDQQRLWGYVYYAFEFPVLRNNIAHGNMVTITAEMAYDTLMDIFYLFHEIESNDREYKIILDFLETFTCKHFDKDNAYVLKYFSSDLQCEENLRWLEKCLDGNYDSMLAWYNHADTLNNLKELFKSDKFRISIYDYEPLETSGEEELEGKQYSSIRINRELENYIPLLNLLKNYINFPQRWMSDVEQRIHDISEKDKESDQLISNLGL